MQLQALLTLPTDIMLTSVQECLAPDERCCSGPRVLQFVLESCPLAESPNLQSTYKVRERHFALLQGILRGDGAPELEL